MRSKQPERWPPGAQSLDLDDTKTITMEELAEGLRKQGSPVAQKELEARASPPAECFFPM